MMTQGHTNDIFTPIFWAMDHAKSYWGAVAHVDMGGHVRLMDAHMIGALEGMSPNLVFNYLPTWP